MTFGASYRVLDEILDETFLETQTANDVARKAGAKGFTTSASTVTTGGIWGNFAYLNSTAGYQIDYPGGVSYFPDGTPSFSRFGDMTGVRQARLIVNVPSGGEPDVVLSVEGISTDPLELGLYFLPELPVIIVGDWTDVTVSGRALLQWRITASNPGSVTVGLCQLQLR